MRSTINYCLFRYCCQDHTHHAEKYPPLTTKKQAAVIGQPSASFFYLRLNHLTPAYHFMDLTRSTGKMTVLPFSSVKRSALTPKTSARSSGEMTLAGTPRQTI